MRKSGPEDSSLLLSEIIFSLGDVLNYINNRAFEQVGEFVGQIKRIPSADTHHATGTRPKHKRVNKAAVIDPDVFVNAIESVELLLETVAEWYAAWSGVIAIKWVVVVTIQILK